MPIVDDPFDFGRIAATNALSDVYAMGATPILALAIVGMPLGKLPVATDAAILAGGASVCAAAGIPVAGGHSIDSAEPIYGLVAIGLVHPDRVLRNCTARAGDVLILTKPLGVGVLSAALKQGRSSRRRLRSADRLDHPAQRARRELAAHRRRARGHRRHRLRPARPRAGNVPRARGVQARHPLRGRADAAGRRCAGSKLASAPAPPHATGPVMAKR